MPLRNPNPAKLRVAQFGLGPIGVASLKLLIDKPWAEVVGAVDIDPAKAGRDLGEVTEDPRFRGAPVTETFDELFDRVGGLDVVLHTAGSRAEASIRQIEPMAKRGVHAASTCEELLFPWLRAPEAADRLQDICSGHGARVVGTGVNPGFVMDLLPVVNTGVSLRVDSVYAERVVDATTRRGPLQKKIGSGLPPEEFQRLFQQQKAGHAGFKESVALIAHALNWPWDDLEETLEPVVADHVIETPHVRVEPGQTRGLHQVCTGKVDGVVKVHLDLIMALEAEDPHDTVRLAGDPPLECRYHGGVAGDKATVAALVNAARRLADAPAGLLLMTDLPAPKHG